ncbi:nucleotide exchange factor GrpE [Lentibacillus cibarius]|uniref:nucleotide exchange factor GrpE n=1 Tax=Lentibacillus cibarius TaxID=2583219 RepID=UPI001F21DC7B|nr:nucleotide exchange factor GrpE [Lentibacillus cibarius]
MTEQRDEKTINDETEHQVRQDSDMEDDTITEVIDADAQTEAQQTDHDETEQGPLQAELDKVKQEKEEMHQRVLRIQAEFDNFKKRTQKEKEADLKYKSEDIVKDLLPVLDNFERALQVEVTDETKNFAEGITMVYRQLKDALSNHGVKEIESVGKPFDPTIHHAVMQEEDEEAEPESVIEELQKGYYLKDRVIRPAMVKVNK